jgi:hypothetical protein
MVSVLGLESETFGFIRVALAPKIHFVGVAPGR